jgi:hypothetical protein
MSAELKAKLAQVAARIAATQERLRGLERSAASLRHDLESLRTEVQQETVAGAAIDEDEWGHRVPTQPLAVGRLGGGRPPRAPGVTAGADPAGAEPQEPEAPAAADDEPWPDR